MSKKNFRFANRLYNRLRELQESRDLLVDINEDIANHHANSPDSTSYVSTYERERAVQHIEAAQAAIWNMIGLLTEHDPDFINEEHLLEMSNKPLNPQTP